MMCFLFHSLISMARCKHTVDAMVLVHHTVCLKVRMPLDPQSHLLVDLYRLTNEVLMDVYRVLDYQ